MPRARGGILTCSRNSKTVPASVLVVCPPTSLVGEGDKLGVDLDHRVLATVQSRSVHGMRWQGGGLKSVAVWDIWRTDLKH